jgi:5'-nucleotidase
VASGEIVDEASGMDGAVDAVVAGHTHTYMNTRVGGAVVVEGGKYGETITAVDLSIDRTTGEVMASSADIIPTYNDELRPDPELRELVEGYTDRVAPISNRVVGTAAESINGSATEAGESPLGNLVADARRAKTDADIAFVLTGALPSGIEAGEVTYGGLSASHPGTNTLMSVELTSGQIREALESQYRSDRDRVLQTSGLRFTHDPSRPLGDRITSVTLENGTPLEEDETYTVAAEEFVAGGGNGFDVFTEGENPTEHGAELDALVEYLEGLPQPFEAPESGERIRIVGLTQRPDLLP